MSQLLKNALLDARAIRSTALENAKIALNEAFTPKLQSMLSKKIAEETLDDECSSDEDMSMKKEAWENPALSGVGSNPAGVSMGGVSNAKDRTLYGGNNINEEDMDSQSDDVEPTSDIDDVPSEEMEADVEVSVDAPEGVNVDIVKMGSGNVSMKDMDMDDDSEEINVDDEDLNSPSEDELELESIIKELEQEVDMDSADDSKKVKVVVTPLSSDIDVDVEDSSEEDQSGDEVDMDDHMDTDMDDDGDEEVNLEEILRELESSNLYEMEKTPSLTNAVLKSTTEDPEGSEMNNSGYKKTTPALKDFPDRVMGKNQGGGMDKTASMKAENIKLKSDLKEHIDVVKFLRGKINEVNLLNAKLLYANKLFRNYALTNEQKMKVIESLDLTRNTREVKLTYTTLAEQFNFSVSPNKKVNPSSIQRTITEGLASKPVASTKPTIKTEVLSEGAKMSARFQKLAGIKLTSKK